MKTWNKLKPELDLEAPGAVFGAERRRSKAWAGEAQVKQWGEPAQALRADGTVRFSHGVPCGYSNGS